MSSLDIYKGAKVVVTGHTGFKGSWLVAWLKQLGAIVSGVSIDIPSKPSHYLSAKLHDQVDDYRIDIRDNNELKLCGITPILFMPVLIFNHIFNLLGKTKDSNNSTCSSE